MTDRAKPSLPLNALTPVPGGFLAAQVPRAQSARFRTVDPFELEPGYLDLAAEGVAAALNVLLAQRAIGNGLGREWLPRLHFVEPVGGPPDGTSQIGYAAFFLDLYPDRIFIVVPWVPPDALLWITAHETAHLAYYAELGSNGYAPDDQDNPSERFADKFADFVAGPRPLPEPGEHRLLTGRLPGTLAQIEGAITVANAGAVVIIDGTSNMFKIAATGTQSLAGGDGTGEFGSVTTVSVVLSTGLTFHPASHHYMLDSAEIAGAISLPHVIWFITNGFAQSRHMAGTIRGSAELVNTNQTKVWAQWATVLNNSGASFTIRFYVMKEVAI